MNTMSVMLGFLPMLCDPLAVGHARDLPAWLALTLTFRNLLITALSVRTLRRYRRLS